MEDKHIALLYEVKRLTTEEIAGMYGVCPETIRKKLIKLGVQRRTGNARRRFDPPKKELKALYQQFSMRQIADKFGVGETVVWKRLKEHKITLKDYELGGHRRKPGRIFSEDHLAHIRKAAKARRGKWVGEKNPHWKGGLAAVNLRLRASGAYREWKRAALALAENRCQQCGVENSVICKCCGVRVSLHVHHVFSFAKHPNKRFDPANSEVLCPKCHRSRHK